MKTRDILKSVLFLALIIMLTASCNKKDEGPKLDFDMTVPSNWNYAAYGDAGSASYIVYYAVSPVKNDSDSITEDIVVTKYVANTSDLHTFYGAYVTNLAKDTSYEALSAKDTTINGEPAVKLTHLQTIPAVNLAKHDTLILYAKIQKYVMINKGYGFVVSFNALRTTFDEYHPLFDNIIATFNFKE